ncbi:MAG TPA: tRNA uracil 4-sulfurtransferase ThiI [Nitrospiria bacterium]|jgi:thiamine biosynthesis protein ThiI|nr:tRNA uracil 4-sulfurtransferase ThiI [Nitrospiria bacterium]
MAEPRFDCVVVHYHEIALKGGNRPMFVRRLAENLRKATHDLGGVRVLTPYGRILIQLEQEIAWPVLRERVRGVFGVANFSPACRTAREPEAMETFLHAALAGKSFASFRISARRSDKNYPLTSVELNERLGRFVQNKSRARVDLKNPELTIHVELLRKEALVYYEKHDGPGGLPVGVSGPVLSLISGGIDSPVASYFMMKRGCSVAFVHFHGFPYLTKASLEKAEELVQHLTRHQYKSRLYAVAFGEIQRLIVLSAPPPLRVVLYRRFMVRIAEEIARRERAKAIVTGENLGQVASQTLENLTAIQAAARLPVLRPLIGFDKEEIIDWAKTIGTYPVSIQPDQDCCRLFIPPHPSVAAGIGEVEKAERELNIPDLVKMGLETAERTEFTFP